jgi:hypothetical protein
VWLVVAIKPSAMRPENIQTLPLDGHHPPVTQVPLFRPHRCSKAAHAIRLQLVVEETDGVFPLSIRCFYYYH